MNTKELEVVIDAVLVPAGFQKRRDTWYKLNDDTVCVVNLQKSQWGGRYYVNLGVYLRSLGKATFPCEFECHLRTRLSGLSGNERSKIDAALDLERVEMPGGERERILRHAVADIAVPFLAERSLLPMLRILNSENRLGSGFIDKAARDLLHSPLTIS